MHMENNIPTCLDDWELFKTEFLQYFTLPGQEDADRDRLDTCRQRNDVASYNAEFMHLIVLVPDNSEKWVLHKYIKGLKNPMQEMVKLSKPNDLNVAMEQALEVESSRHRPYQKYTDFRQPYKNSHNTNMGVAPMELGSLEQGNIEPIDSTEPMDMADGSPCEDLNALIRPTKQPPPSPCPLCKGMHWKSDCPRNTRARTPSRPSSSLTCFHCKKPGHKKVQCPQLRSSPN